MSTAVRCNDPAQTLLTVNEMRTIAAGGQPPADFAQRVALAVEFRSLIESPNVHYRHSSPHALTDLLSWPELAAHLHDGALPDDFAGRVSTLLADEVCINCDNRRCMGCVTRTVEHRCAADCPSCC